MNRTVDEHLPRWLHSKILTAVDYIWQVKGSDEETMKRVARVAKKFDGEEMCWVMMLLTLPKLNHFIMNSSEIKEFKKERIVH